MLGVASKQLERASVAVDERATRRRYWLTAGRETPRSWLAIKRIGDILASTALLAALAPVFAVAAVAVKLASSGPVFFSQLRVGKDGRLFRMYKFRTMHDGAHLLHDRLRHLNDLDGPVFKIANDPRLHRFGSLLRRSSIDELPQLWNVLRGDMSIVGPRPALPSEVERYEPHYLQRLTVAPGITGLWQVSGRTRVPFRRWMAMDVWYARRWSPLVDVALVMRTLPAVVRGDGAC